MDWHWDWQRGLLMDWHWDWQMGQQRDWQREWQKDWHWDWQREWLKVWHLEQHLQLVHQMVQRRGRNFHWDSLRVRHWGLLMDWQRV